MKKSILKIAALTLTVSAILTGCNTPAEKAQANAVEANTDFTNAQVDYTTDVEKYRKETDAKIEANEKSMDEFNVRIENEKKEVKADYRKKIEVLEQKNTDMKKRMDDYKADGKEKWESFKTDFDKDMDEMEQSLKDLISNHSKK